jgi:hypothetical protein
MPMPDYIFLRHSGVPAFTYTLRTPAATMLSNTYWNTWVHWAFLNLWLTLWNLLKCRIVRHPVILATEWKGPCRHRSHTGRRVHSPVPNANRLDWDAGCRNGDAGDGFDAILLAFWGNTLTFRGVLLEKSLLLSRFCFLRHFRSQVTGLSVNKPPSFCCSSCHLSASVRYLLLLGCLSGLSYCRFHCLQYCPGIS